MSDDIDYHEEALAILSKYGALFSKGTCQADFDTMAAELAKWGRKLVAGERALADEKCKWFLERAKKAEALAAEAESYGREYIEKTDPQIDRLMEQNAEKDDTIRTLKSAVQREAGYDPKHCVCVFNESDEPIGIECDLHKEQRAKIAELALECVNLERALGLASETEEDLKSQLADAHRRLAICDPLGWRS